EQNLTFRLLVGYRWISLLPPLIWLTIPAPGSVSATGWRLLALVVGLTLSLTLAARPINRLLLRQPGLLVLDLLFSAGLIWYTDAERSPYYLYSLAPLLAAAFFFRIRGGLLAAAVYASFYLLVVLLVPRAPGLPLNIPAAVGQIISFFLIGAIFGYPAVLLQRLRHTYTELALKNAELSQRNRDLNLLHKLSLAMQSSVDPAELQEYILRGLVQEMGYPRAVIGLYDEQCRTLTGWLTLAEPSPSAGLPRIAHTDLISLDEDDGPLARALKVEQAVEVLDGAAPTGSPHLNDRLEVGPHYLVLPMSLREHPIGVILIDGLAANQPLSPTDRLSLDHLAAHAGVALGSVRLCIYRAQREAITEERNRIAAGLHDSISQILYGLAYGLEACMQLLPHEAKHAQSALTKLYPLVMDAQAQMRHAIFEMWSDEIAADTFVAGLHRHLRAIHPTQTITLKIELPGDFDRWEAAARSQLYRVAQEALTNAAKHAAPHQVIVTLARNNQHLELRIEDDGRGFNPAEVDGAQHLGIQSMAERIKGLGGDFDICSESGKGTIVTARIPYR
ncbi:MAG: GAF domain-containing sensor histidine kinase, partial [Chloroflexota bacterium]